MAKRPPKTILFLCTGNYFRSRFAEILFNHVAGKLGLPWKASSKGLALERGMGNVGPMALVAIKTLEKMGVRAKEDVARFPLSVTTEDFDNAQFIVALQETEHLPLLQERFSVWVEKVEFWDVDDDPKVLGLIEREVMDLVSRLVSGRKRVPLPVEEEPATPTGSVKKDNKASGFTVRVGRETKGRRGKGVTIVSDLPLDEADLQEFASKLKQTCGTGGTVNEGRIEIQGDQRRRITWALEGMGCRVKQVGG